MSVQLIGLSRTYILPLTSTELLESSTSDPSSIMMILLIVGMLLTKRRRIWILKFS